jgi:RNA polymerase sigma-70 factor (ECF subfamily)
MGHAIDIGDLRLVPLDGPAVELPAGGGPGPLTIGRLRSCDIPLPHPSVSRRHATLRCRAGHWLVTDLGSRHGTDVNTIRLEPHEETRLADQDLLRIGPWTLQAHCADAAAEPPPPLLPSPLRPAAAEPETRATIFLRLRTENAERRELSWRQFAERYGPVITGFARQAGSLSAEADEVLQDVLIGFFRASDAFQYDPGKGRFRGYLRSVTVNAIRARARAARAHRALDLGEMADDVADRSWSEQWGWQLVKSALEEARLRFEPRTWEAFELYGRRGVPAAEVAARLGMREESVRHAKSRVTRAAREIVARMRWEEG